MLSVEYQKSISEVLDILDNTDESLVNKIPKKFIEFLNKNKSNIYVPNLEYDKQLNEMNLMPKTKSILSVIYMKYWANEKELNEIKNIQRENEKSYQKQLEQKYSYDSLFKNNEERNEEVTANIIKYEKENFIISLVKKIFNVFKRK